MSCAKPFTILHKNLWEKHLNPEEDLHDHLIQATKKMSAKEILHIPQILASIHIDNQKNHLVPIVNAVKNNFPTKEPLVSIIIPTRDQGQLLKTCINSIYQKTKYTNFEIILIDHQSSEKKAIRVIDFLREKPNSRIEKYSGNFNFSAMVNKGAEIAQGEIITLLNNDTEIIEENWLELLVTQTIRKEVGVCGPLLLFKNRTIQHAGIHPSKNALMIHGHKHEKENKQKNEFITYLDPENIFHIETKKFNFEILKNLIIKLGKRNENKIGEVEEEVFIHEPQVIKDLRKQNFSFSGKIVQVFDKKLIRVAKGSN